MFTRNEWVHLFVGIWAVLATVFGRAIGVLTDPNWVMGASVSAAFTFAVSVAIRQARESVAGKPAPEHPIPWWMGEAVCWQFVAVCALAGAWLGYGLGPWIGAVGGFLVIGGAAYLVVALVAWIWTFVDVMRSFASMTPDPRDPNRAR